MEDDEKMSILVLDEETLEELKEKKIYLAKYQNKIVKVKKEENNEASIIGTLRSDQEVSLIGPPPVSLLKNMIYLKILQ